MFNFDKNDWTSLLINIIMLGALVSSLFIRSSDNRNIKIKQVTIWLTIIFFGVLLYNNKHLFSNFVPYIAKDNSEKTLEIRKSSDNHFYITLNINGTNILFLIDTGATTTSLTSRDAKRLGIDINSLTYNQLVNTANGINYNASYNIKNIKVGDYHLDNLWVLINKNMPGNSLLGMNFLNKLKAYEIRQDRMILYY